MDAMRCMLLGMRGGYALFAGGDGGDALCATPYSWAQFQRCAVAVFSLQSTTPPPEEFPHPGKGRKAMLGVTRRHGQICAYAKISDHGCDDL